MTERMSASYIIKQAAIWYGPKVAQGMPDFGEFILGELMDNGYAVVELPEPDEFIPAVAGAPKIVARWDSVETGEVTVWEGGVVDVFGQTMLSPEDALTLSGVIVRASQIAAAAAERNSEGQ